MSMRTTMSFTAASFATLAYAQCPTLTATPPGLTPAFTDVVAEVASASDPIGMSLADYIGDTGDLHAPGGVFADLNGDGYPELYLPLADPYYKGYDSANRLYVNISDGKGGREYRLATVPGAAADAGDATGAIAGDYDNDGDLDLYVTNYDGPNRLLKNMWVETGPHSGDTADLLSLTYTDVTDQAGVGTAYGEGVPLDDSLVSCWADVDRDGDLDLYVGNLNKSQRERSTAESPGSGQRDIFYINNGNGTFSDVTMSCGLLSCSVTGYLTTEGRIHTADQRYTSANAAIFADLNADQWPDLYVVNLQGDSDMFYLNQGDDGAGGWLGFEMVSFTLPNTPAFGSESPAGMGVDVGDFDNDGDLDLYITDTTPNQNDVWVNQLSDSGTMSFVHCTQLASVFGWGAQWADFDNNGWLDLHAATNEGLLGRLYMNTAGTFYEAASELGVSHIGDTRGDMTADYNRDGFIDLFTLNIWDAPSNLYRNDFAAQYPGHRHLSLRLSGDPLTPGPAGFYSSRDALGSRVRVSADVDGDGSVGPGETQIREIRAGGSNASSTSSLEAEFGLGATNEPVVGVEIIWASGRVMAFYATPDQFIDVNEADLLIGDLNNDCIVDSLDEQLLLDAMTSGCPAAPGVCPADLNGDGLIDGTDMALLSSQLGQSC